MRRRLMRYSWFLQSLILWMGLTPPIICATQQGSSAEAIGIVESPEARPKKVSMAAQSAVPLAEKKNGTVVSLTLSPLTSEIPISDTIPANTSTSICALSSSQYTINVPSNALQLIVTLSGSQDVDLFVRFGQPVIHLEGQSATDFSSETTLSHETVYVSPQSTPSLFGGTYYIGVANCASSPASFTLIATVIMPSSPFKIEELSMDNGILNLGLSGDGLMVVNRLTPARYPSTLKSIRIFITKYQNKPDPVGKSIRLIAFVDSSGVGHPSVPTPSFLVDQNVSVDGESGYVDFNLLNGPTITAGDFYIGFQYATPNNGVLAGADTELVQRQRSFFSTDKGATFQGNWVFSGSNAPINLMIRGVTENVAPGNTSTGVVLSSGGAGTSLTAGSSGAVQSGFARVNLNSGSFPYGTAVFSLTQNGVVVSEAGVPASPPTTAARIFIDYRNNVFAKRGSIDAGAVSVNTGLAVVNLGSSTASLVYRLRDFAGTVLATGHGTLGSNEHVAKFFTELQQIAPDFQPPSNFATAIQFGTLEVSSDQPISIVALRLTVNQRRDTLLTTTPIADLTRPMSSTQLFFPQMADGGGFRFSLFVLNTSNSTETGTVRIFNNTGGALGVHQIGDPPGSFSVFNYRIQPGGFNTLLTDGAPGVVNVGSVQIIPDVGTSTPVGAGVFSLTQGGILVTESGVASATPTTHARIFIDQSSGHRTGLAVASPGSSSGFLVSLNAFQSDGVTPAGSGSLFLPGNGHDARFVNEFLPSLPNGFTGVLDISAPMPFVALTLRSLTNARRDSLLTTFPLADVNQPAPFPLIFPQIADGGGFQTQFFLLSTSGGASTTLNLFGIGRGPVILNPVLNGVVSEAPLHGATVNFFSLNADGTKGALVGTTQTDDSGVYNVTLNSNPTGPILAEAKGGFYVDEVTKGTVTLKPDDQVTAIFPLGTTTGAITPLTDMAATRARTLAASGISLTTAMDASNIEVAEQFSLKSIIETLPADASSVTNIQIATRDERDYGFLLGGIAQEAQGLNVRAIDLAAAMAADFSDGILDGKNNGTVIMIPTISGGSIPSPFLSASKDDHESQGGLNQLAASVTFFIANLPPPINQVTYTFPSGPVTVAINGAGLFYCQNTTLPAAVAGRPYSATIGAAGGIGVIKCALAPGSTLPAGFTLNGCVLTSTPVPLLGSGTSMVITPPFTIIITDSALPPHMVQVSWQITIVQPPPVIIFNAPGRCIVRTFCRVPLVGGVTGGIPPYYFLSDTFRNGAPPFGMIVDLNGDLVGTPSLAGVFGFGVCVVDLVGSNICGQTSVEIVNQQRFTLSTTKAGSGTGTVTANPPGPSYDPGTVVTLTATPDANSTFAGWSGDCSGAGSCVLTMDSDKSVTATFNLKTSTNFTLTIAKAGSGNGTVTANPPGLSYSPGTIVTLTATPDANSTFAGWSGDCAGTGSCVVTMTSNRSVTATFNSNIPGGSVSQFDGSYTGSYSGVANFSDGTSSPQSGPVAFTVSNGIITVTQPGSGSGTVDATGSSNFSGSLTGLGGTCNFTGTFVVSSGGQATASGSWNCTFPSATANGTWSAAR